MLKLAILIGLYSYSILVLGLLHFLYPFPILFLTLLFIALLHPRFKSPKTINKIKIFFKESHIQSFSLVILILLSGINIIGVLGPELSFDALWYHLTIPKIFLNKHSVFFIKGNLFYYSLMPKLTEMLYVTSLSLSGEILAKGVHFLFGIFSCIILFKISRLYLSKKFSLLVVLVFYSNLVVMWLSMISFSDLARTFYESYSLYYFLRYSKNGKYKELLISALLLGFGVCTKILSLGSLPIFILLIILLKNISITRKIKQSIAYFSIVLLVPLPWFLISLYHTGNPIYPLFSSLGLRGFTADLFSPIVFLKTFFGIFLFAPDPINPVYLIILPLLLYSFKKTFRKYANLIIYSVLSYLIWYFTSQEGGSRFLVPFLTAYSLLSVLAISECKNRTIKKIGILVIFIVGMTSVIYRGAANLKYIPVIVGKESKEEFLMKNLNFSFGDFYDENNEIKKLVGENIVLLWNVHNLYYLNFNYIIELPKDMTDIHFVLVQNYKKPEVLSTAKVIYKNSKTHVTLYKL